MPPIKHSGAYSPDLVCLCPELFIISCFQAPYLRLGSLGSPFLLPALAWLPPVVTLDPHIINHFNLFLKQGQIVLQFLKKKKKKGSKNLSLGAIFTVDLSVKERTVPGSMEGRGCWGRGTTQGESALASAEESLQCLSGLPCHKHRGHLTYQTQIKMTRRWLTSEAALCSFGNSPSLWFSEIL